jgi:O-antigen ligase
MAAADRLLMQLTVITGVALVAAEFLGSVADVRRVLRVLCWGGAFCGVVAALQYWVSLDISTSLRELPGFSVNGTDPGIITRGALNRVSGTAVYPIELGVVAGMLLPLAIYLGFHDTGRSAVRRWTPAALIALGVPASVSRSAILAFVVALAVLIVLMPVRQRLIAFLAMPLTLVAVFMTAPGLIGTLATFFGAGTSDASVQSRLSDYPMVERFLADAPWFGRGGWTYIAPNAFDVLDNQYLKTAVELGLVGVLALAVFFIVPALAALSARRRSADPELRFLCAALTGAALAAAVCSLTFDSLSYPMFIGVYALIIGLIGAGWRLAVGAEVPARSRPDAGLTLAGPVPGTLPILRAGG